MSENSAKRVRRHREKLRAIGLRPVQFWAPDTRGDAFADECRRQSLRVRAAETGSDDPWFDVSDRTGWTV